MKIKTNFIFPENINDYDTPLEEVSYNAVSYDCFLTNEHFHHSDKGCNVKMIVGIEGNGNRFVNKICLTHNITCSKTGWELGWYMGTKSDFKNYWTCQNCGKEFCCKAKNVKYCPECRRLMNIMRSRIKNYEKKTNNANS